jgi:hypothetical protein
MDRTPLSRTAPIAKPANTSVGQCARIATRVHATRAPPRAQPTSRQDRRSQSRNDRADVDAMPEREGFVRFPDFLTPWSSPTTIRSGLVRSTTFFMIFGAITATTL